MSRHLWGVLLTLLLLFLALAAGFSATPAQAAPAASGHQAEVCTNLLVNSDMETDEGWRFGNSPVPARYATDRYVSGHRSMLLGITTTPNKHSYSSIKQFVTVPAGSSLRLRMRVYPLSQPYDAHDEQELLILNSAGKPLRQVWTSISNAQAWQTLEFDLSEFTDMGIGIYFNVYNDGAGGVSAMYLDDVVLELCQVDGATPDAPTATPNPPTNTPAPPTATPAPANPTATPTLSRPTATPTVYTPTPTPGNKPCRNVLRNADFEQNGDWMFGDSGLHGRYVDNPVHKGSRAVLLGNPGGNVPNHATFSSVSQRVTLYTAGMSHATLSFWYYPVSDLESGDTQEVILLNARDGSTIDVLWRVNENDGQWKYQTLDLTPYLGRDVIVYFNVFNNGGTGRAKMYVDDTALQLCGGVAAPTPTPQPPATPTPVPTAVPPTPTPPPTLAPPTPTPTVTPIATAVAILPTATPENTVHMPIAANTATDTSKPLEQRFSWTTALRWLSYVLIALIVGLIFFIALFMIRQPNDDDDPTTRP